MTATPRVYTTRVREAAEEQEIEIASMDDPARFGRVLHHLSFAEAIDREFLSDYRVLVVGVTDVEARRLAESGDQLPRPDQAREGLRLAAWNDHQRAPHQRAANGAARDRLPLR
jgi:predicted helicase